MIDDKNEEFYIDLPEELKIVSSSCWLKLTKK